MLGYDLSHIPGLSRQAGQAQITDYAGTKISVHCLIFTDTTQTVLLLSLQGLASHEMCQNRFRHIEIRDENATSPFSIVWSVLVQQLSWYTQFFHDQPLRSAFSTFSVWMRKWSFVRWITSTSCEQDRTLLTKMWLVIFFLTFSHKVTMTEFKSLARLYW